MSKYRLICLDADGVIFKGSQFWLDLHKAFDTWGEGKALTAKYLHTDYNKLAQEVVYRLWRDRDAKPYLELVKKREYMKGVKELFGFIKKKKWVSAIISGGSLSLIKRAQKDFGADYVFANELILRNGRITGYKAQVEAGLEKKVEIVWALCKKLSIRPKEAIFIGDSKYDLNAFKLVGKAIAFNSDSEELKKHAHVIVNSDDLKDVIPYLENL